MFPIIWLGSRASELAQTPAEKKQIEKYWYDMFKNQWGQPGLHELMKELRAILDEYEGDRMLVGEDDNIAYMGNGNDELNLVFNFPLMRTERLTPSHIRRNQAGDPVDLCTERGGHGRARAGRLQQRRCRACSDDPLVSSRESSDPRTSGRWSTATTSCSCA